MWYLIFRDRATAIVFLGGIPGCVMLVMKDSQLLQCLKGGRKQVLLFLGMARERWGWAFPLPEVLLEEEGEQKRQQLSSLRRWVGEPVVHATAVDEADETDE